MKTQPFISGVVIPYDKAEPPSLAFIDDESYALDNSSLSYSALKFLRKSALHYWSARIDPAREPEEATDYTLDDLFFDLLLRTTLIDGKYAQMPAGIKKNTKAGQQLWEEFERKHLGKRLVAQEVFEKARSMAAAVLETEHGQALVAGGIVRPVIRWNEPFVFEGRRLAVKCRCRPDWLLAPGADGMENGHAIILASCTDAGPGFADHAYRDLSLHARAWWIARGISAFYGTAGDPGITVVAAETKPPHAVAVHEAGISYLAGGKENCLVAMGRLVEADAKGEYQGYSEQKTLELPRWAKENYV